MSKQDIPDLVLELQSIKAEYYRFSIQLRVPHEEIVAWEQQFQRDANRMLGEILQFLFANDHNPMETLYTALQNIDQPKLADELKLKYGGAQGNNVVIYKYLYIIHNGQKKTRIENKSNIWSCVMFLFKTINSKP